jgi:hypothetical protein
MNSPELNRKLSDDAARPAQLAASDLSNQQLVEEAFLLAYGRFPSPDESARALAALPEPEQRRRAVEDLFWALLNTPEFLFID